MKTIAQISAELQGYDPQALTCPDANLFLSKLVDPVTDNESVHLFDALGRVLAQDIISPISVPTSVSAKPTRRPVNTSGTAAGSRIERVSAQGPSRSARPVRR